MVSGHGATWVDDPPPAVLHLQGEWNIFQAETLHALIVENLQAESAGEHLRVDCEELRAIDSAATQVLVAWQQHMNAGGGSLRLIHVADSVRNALEILGASECLLDEHSSANGTSITESAVSQ